MHKAGSDNLISWLLASDEPWTRYRTLVDLLGQPEGDPAVKRARAETLAHPQVRELIDRAATWGQRPIKRHDDASHPLYCLSTLADLGLRADDPGMSAVVPAVLAHQSPEGAFQSLVNIPQAFGGSGEDSWTWVLCDAPTVLYALLAMGVPDEERLWRAADHLAGLADSNGWHCVAAPELGRFKGPGRRSDPCPMANVYALKALAQVPVLADSDATRSGARMLLGHWEERKGCKYYLFGIGTDFGRLKYPFVWYNLLHVVEVLSRFPFVHPDPRFQAMVQALASQADEQGRYTAGSMYLSWKGWSFADKKRPSPWLTLLATRAIGRVAGEPAG